MSIVKERIVAQGHGYLSPKYFAVHSTANPGATAANHASYWTNNPDYAVHLIADWNECLHTVPYDRLCWQVGNGNSTCEGMEICEATNYDDFIRGIEIAKVAILERLAARGWTVDGAVRSHLWFTQNYGGSDHTDPIPYFKRFGWTWDMFVDYLKEDDMTPADVWNYTYGGSPNCFNALHWAYGELSRTDNAGGLGPDSGVNMFGRVCAIDNYAGKILAEVTRTDDPTGRGAESTTHEHVKWIAAAINGDEENPGLRERIMGLEERLDSIDAKLDKIIERLG